MLKSRLEVQYLCILLDIWLKPLTKGAKSSTTHRTCSCTYCTLIFHEITGNSSWFLVFMRHGHCKVGSCPNLELNPKNRKSCNQSHANIKQVGKNIVWTMSEWQTRLCVFPNILLETPSGPCHINYRYWVCRACASSGPGAAPYLLTFDFAPSQRGEGTHTNFIRIPFFGKNTRRLYKFNITSCFTGTQNACHCFSFSRWTWTYKRGEESE